MSQHRRFYSVCVFAGGRVFTKIHYLYVFFLQIWDFASAEKIADVPDDIEYKSQV